MPNARFHASFKSKMLAAEPDAPEGSVSAIVSAYNVRYRIGWALYHTIMNGAFSESLAEQDALPLFWMHSWAWSDGMPIGDAQGSEVPAGLQIDGQLYIDNSPDIANLYRSLKAGAIREWSIGYDVIESNQDPDDDLHFFVTKAEILEASSVLRGANPETETLEVASKAGGLTRISLGGDVIVETSDQDLISRIINVAEAPAKSTEQEQSFEELLMTDLPWSAQERIHDVYGDDVLAVGTK